MNFVDQAGQMGDGEVLAYSHLFSVINHRNLINEIQREMIITKKERLGLSIRI
jgi:hypothetical protein